MNNARTLLLVPIMICSLCLAGAVYLNFRISRTHVELLRANFLRWHQEQMKFDDSQHLKQHAAKLWEELDGADERSVQAFKAIADGVTAVVWVSAANLTFCLAAFSAAKSRSLPAAAMH